MQQQTHRLLAPSLGTQRELISWHPHPSDGRSKEARLTIAGQAQLLDLHQEMDSAMEETLAQLTLAEREQLWTGLRLYRSALSRARRQQGYRIRPITAADNPHIAAVIRAVSAEYGLTADKGYGVADPNLDRLHETYQGAQSRYWVIEGPDGTILGGGGIAPLAGEEGQVCELQKMYFMPSLRGLGLGRRLMLQALDEARALGYQRCYLETTAVLREATALTLKETLSDLRDVNVAEAASRLTQQSTALEAAQASFVRLQGLSLFNYLR